MGISKFITKRTPPNQMTALNRNVFNDYNLNYDPVGLRNISLPNSFFTSLNAYEPMDIEEIIANQTQDIPELPVASIPSNFLNYQFENARTSFTPVREGITTLKDQLGNLKNKGLDFLGSGKELALKGIGSIIGGPVGSFIGDVLGRIKESPTDKVGLANFGGDYDPYGYKSALQHGNLGARQDPFGRNLVSMSNYEKNRIEELKELTQLQNLGLLNNQFKIDKLDFAQNYLEKVKQEREQRQRNKARENFASVYASADEQGFTGPGGGFDTSAGDKAGTSLGSGQFSPSSSRGRSGY